MTTLEAEYTDPECLEARKAALKLWADCGLVPSPMWVEIAQRDGDPTDPFYINFWVGKGPFGPFQVRIRENGSYCFQDVITKKPLATRVDDPHWGLRYLPFAFAPTSQQYRECSRETEQSLLYLLGKRRNLPDHLVPTKFDEWGVDRSSRRW